MRRTIIISIFAACVFAAPQKRPTPDGRIVGGVSVSIEDYPHQISLQYWASHICGGAIISELHILTAAHCTDGANAADLSIRAGSSIRNSGGQVIPVKRIIQHPQYDPETLDFDISILELASPLNLGTGVRPVLLPEYTEEPLPTGTPAFCTGWGTLSEGGSLPDQLQGVEVPIVSRLACRGVYGSTTITDRMICAGFPLGGRDACQGDSGGPLVVNGNLGGIVSWGYGCARPNYPGVYTNVAVLRNFIKEQANV